MQLANIGQLIATRTLKLTNEDSINVVVAIGAPQRFPDEQDYYCPYQITGLGDEKINWCGGIDAIQALLLTLEHVGNFLNSSEEYKKGYLSWLGSDSGNLGFPHHDSSGMLSYLNLK